MKSARLFLIGCLSLVASGALCASVLFDSRPASAQILFNPSNADMVTVERMQKAGRLMRRIYKEKGHLPQTEDEVKEALAALAADDLLSDSAPKEPNTRGYFRMSVDPGINAQVAQAWKRSPPGSWQAPLNGIVTIISSGDSFFIVWGAGMNFGPILDPNSGRAIILAEDLREAPR